MKKTVMIIIGICIVLAMFIGTVAADWKHSEPLFYNPAQVISMQDFPQYGINGQEYFVDLSTGESLMLTKDQFDNISLGATYIFWNPKPLANNAFIVDGFTERNPAPDNMQVISNWYNVGIFKDTVLTVGLA
jgi:hypothetical protein